MTGVNASMFENYPKEIEEEFERQFGLQGVRAEFSQWIPLQVNLKISVPVEPTPEMKALGEAIEAEHAEFDQTVWVHVVRKRPEHWLRSCWRGLRRQTLER
jgi:hypothetical protein